jgi:NADH-quinone oxidoreductase subunit L
MVTAGIYMVFRSNPLYSLAPDTLEFIAYIGAATALLGALIGLAQNDIKKVLAYSTVSQLGYMFMALGVGAYSSSLFHVVTHAFFKALLFLGAGSVIHAMSNEQDIRTMGGLAKPLRITFLTFLIGTIAISGIPPFSGFFSKDEILFNLYLHNKPVWAIGLLGSFLTAFYMFRLLYLTFFGNFRGNEHQKEHLHESPVAMTLPLLILAVLATLGGLLNVPEALGGHSALANWLSPVIAKSIESAGHGADHQQLEFILMSVSVLVALAGIGLASVVYLGQKRLPVSETSKLSPIHNLVYHKFYVDEVYDWIIVKPLAFLSRVFGFVFEYLIIDLAVAGIGALARVTGKGLRYIQSGSTGFYLLIMVTSIGLYLAFLFQDNLFSLL